MEKHIRKTGRGSVGGLESHPPIFSLSKNEKSDSYLSQSEERFSSTRARGDLAVEFRETDLTT